MAAKIRTPFKKYTPGMSGESVENCAYYINHCNRFIEDTSLQGLDLGFSVFLEDQETQVLMSNWPEEDKVKVAKKALAYWRKELKHETKIRNKYHRERKEEDRLAKVFENLKNVTYERDADKAILSKVISHLKINKQLRKQSIKVTIEARCYSRRDHERSCNRFEYTNHYVSGEIDIEGHDTMYFDDLFMKSSGWDNFPPS